MLEPDREPDRALGDAGAGEVIGAHAKVRRRCRVDHERFGVSDVREVREDLEALDEAPALLARAAQVEAEHGAAATR
jgi:hypothetical protein